MTRTALWTAVAGAAAALAATLALAAPASAAPGESPAGGCHPWKCVETVELR